MDRAVTVQEVMDRAFLGVSESDDLRDTVEMMLDDGAECVLVLRGQEPVGVLTERDVLAQVVAGDVEGATVADAMTEAVPTVDPDVTLSAAADELSARATQRLVVTDGTEPVGVVTEHDLMSALPVGRDRTEATPERAAAMAAAGETAGPTVAESRAFADDQPGFEEQAICEACGSFSRDLSAFNGQLLCGDCRDI